MKWSLQFLCGPVHDIFLYGEHTYDIWFIVQGKVRFKGVKKIVSAKIG